MNNAYIVDYVRTPIGRYGGALSSVRPDDLAAHSIRALLARQSAVELSQIDEVYLGCANQAGEDNRNIARMALLLGGIPENVAGVTLNRLCGSGMEAVIQASRAVMLGDQELVLAGGVESMSRAPFVVPKANSAFSRASAMEDTTIGWRFVNPLMQASYGVDSMPETAENVAVEFNICRESQDAFALQSQLRAAKAQEKGRFALEIAPIEISQRKGGARLVDCDEHLRPETTLQTLSRLPTPFRSGGSVTAGNSSGVNDGSAALMIASESLCQAMGLKPIARILGSAAVGVAPRIMGIGPVSATRKLCEKLGMNPTDFDIVELNEAFASQSIAVLRALGIAEDSERVNPNGGAIALGHPLGMSGARLVGTAALELRERGQGYALATMCVGVGQGVAVAIESVS